MTTFYNQVPVGRQVSAASFQKGRWRNDKVALGGRRLFDQSNPVRILCDMRLGSSGHGGGSGAWANAGFIKGDQGDVP